MIFIGKRGLVAWKVMLSIVLTLIVAFFLFMIIYNVRDVLMPK